ncbi:unnamed protein product [Ixodes persulcatus]
MGKCCRATEPSNVQQEPEWSVDIAASRGAKIQKCLGVSSTHPTSSHFSNGVQRTATFVERVRETDCFTQTANAYRPTSRGLQSLILQHFNYSYRESTKDDKKFTYKPTGIQNIQ